MNIFSILQSVRDGEALTYAEGKHLLYVFNSRRNGRTTTGQFVQMLAKRTKCDWLWCDDSGIPFPDDQRATTVGDSEDAVLFQEHIQYGHHSYVWARHTYGDEGWCDEEDTHWVDSRDYYITNTNYRHNYFTCTSCNEVIHTDRYAGNGECDDCYSPEPEADGDIYEYHIKIEEVLSMRLTPGVRYFGLEIEQELDDRDSDVPWALNNIDGLSDMAIWKKDGSLNDGAELVTLPKTLKYWRDDNPIQSLCKNKTWRSWAKSHNTTTCGLHIHVSRNTVPEPVIAKLVYLFNEPGMTELLALVARRAPTTSWCCAEKKRWHSERNYVWESALRDYDGGYRSTKPEAWQHVRPSPQKKQITQGGRYTPVNLTEHTLEFRIFRGTLRWETILASIEFCDAAISYCQQFGARHLCAENFTAFLKDHATRKTYPALRDYLELRTVLPKRRQKPQPQTSGQPVQMLDQQPVSI